LAVAADGICRFGKSVSRTCRLSRHPEKHPDLASFGCASAVADDLRPIIGQREEKRSLRTKDAAEAKRVLAAALVEVEERWSNLRRGPVELTEALATTLALPVYDAWIAKHADNPTEQQFWDVKVGLSIWTESPSLLGASQEQMQTIVKYASIKSECALAADELLRRAGVKTTEKGRDRVAYSVRTKSQFR